MESVRTRVEGQWLSFCFSFPSCSPSFLSSFRCPCTPYPVHAFAGRFIQTLSPSDAVILKMETISHADAAQLAERAVRQTVSVIRAIRSTLDSLLTFYVPRIGCCKTGYYCYATGCCPNGDSGCEGNSCCSPGETCCKGGGCCESGCVSRTPTFEIIFSDFERRYYCTVVNGQRGCCENGKTCTSSSTPECTTTGYVLCSGENFCCRKSILIIPNRPTIFNTFHQHLDTSASVTLLTLPNVVPRLPVSHHLSPAPAPTLTRTLRQPLSYPARPRAFLRVHRQSHFPPQLLLLQGRRRRRHRPPRPLPQTAPDLASRHPLFQLGSMISSICSPVSECSLTSSERNLHGLFPLSI